MKKSLSLFMAILFFLFAMVSCRQESYHSGETTKSPSQSDGIFDSENDRLSASDGLEAIDYNGAQYKIAALEILQFEVFAEDTSETVDAAVHNRNLRVEDKYNIEFVPVITTGYASGGGQVHIDAVKNSIDADDGLFDTTLMSANRVGPLIADGYFCDWYDGIPGVNFRQPWWNQQCNDTFTVNDMLFGAVGDISLSGISQAFAYLFNANMAEDLQLENLYQVVRDGKWTIDYVKQITQNVYTDMNKDGARDDGDAYGFATGLVQNLDAYLPSYDIHLVETDESGELVVSLDADRERLQTALEKVSALFYNSTGTHIDSQYGDRFSMFAEGRILLSDMHLNCMEKYLRGMTDTFGVLPYPKLDESQEGYYTNALNNFTVLCLPYTTDDLDMIGRVTETLCCETYRTVVTAYYETALKDKYTDTADDEEMLDIIVAGRNYDLAVLFISNLDNIYYFFRNEVAEKSNNVATKLDANYDTWTAALVRLQEKYVELAS